MNKKLIFALYTLIVVCIGFATIIEKHSGTGFVNEHVYGTWWFAGLWVVLSVAACAYVIRQQLYKRAAVMLLHVAFVVILTGALVTHLFARSGTIRLRTGIPSRTYIDKDGHYQQLPFSLTLKEFSIIYYPGTDAPLDYQSVIQHVGGEDVLVSMNNIGHIDDYRFFQSSFDSDGKGVSLGVSHDPYGIAITYFGYLLLLAGIIATLLSRKTRMHVLYRKATQSLAILLPLAFYASSVHADDGLPVVDKEIAHRLGAINVLYNNRICPLNTVATDFITKLSGSASWEGYSADEIFVSWMIYYSPWEKQKLIRVKNHEVQQLLGINGQWASYCDFLDEYHEYKLKKAVEKQKKGDGSHGGKALMEADEKFHVVEMFYRGQFIKMFPYRSGKAVNWYMPGGQSLPKEIPVKEQFFIKQSMDYLTESIVTGQRDRAYELIAKIKLFQNEMTNNQLPSGNKTKAEIFYNTMRCQKWPVFLALTLSLLVCLALIATTWRGTWFKVLTLSFIVLLATYVMLLLGLRWWLSGHIPVSNGHEVMLFMAWVLLLLTILLRHQFPIVSGFGPLIASFCLLVAMLAGSNSQITPLMPVLQSPLLSIHVMTVMCAYALFALQLLLGVQAFLLIRKKRNDELERVTALSQLLLYPAVFLLAIGIFLGAVWANVSWGNYWSWDPKESWALITLMIYAVPFHIKSVGIFRKPCCYHIYMVGAFLAVIITYFGVNYILGGMHGYI
ncbi:MAG: cytochrome c biogenesis protein CcsA [Prevotella sp.]|nr:cytochrome c biogenesis protein CcsA [Prevotella sp.]